MAFHESEYQHLPRILEGERKKSSLPEQAAGRGAINDLLIRIRLADYNSLESKVLSSLSRILGRPSQ
jgi:hypothetical protein